MHTKSLCFPIVKDVQRVLLAGTEVKKSKHKILILSLFFLSLLFFPPCIHKKNYRTYIHILCTKRMLFVHTGDFCVLNSKKRASQCLSGRHHVRSPHPGVTLQYLRLVTLFVEISNNSAGHIACSEANFLAYSISSNRSTKVNIYRMVHIMHIHADSCVCPAIISIQLSFC